MSIIESILKPYKVLFKDSKEQPKEIGVGPEVKKPEKKLVEGISNTRSKRVKSSKAVIPSDNRAGKVLWKKK